MIAAIVLAAGAGSRYGGAKVVALHDGMPLVAHVVHRLRSAGVNHIVATVGEHAAVIGSVLDTLEVTLVPVPPGSAMSDSLRCGADALPEGCDAFVVAHGDQPLIDPEVVARLVAVWEHSNAAAVVPLYSGGVRGHPVLFDATMRRHFTTLSGDRGAGELLQRMGDRVALLPVDAEVPVDVDTREDLRRLDA